MVMKWFTRERAKQVERNPLGELKDFAAQLPKHDHVSYHHLGIAAVPIEKIVGSVGRAHELDKHFHYRRRAITERYQQAMVSLCSGEPSQPIKVYKLKRPRTSSEYYVLDGHHRLAAAIQQGYHDVNARVTEVQVHDLEI
jgi:hypothetical protein